MLNHLKKVSKWEDSYSKDSKNLEAENSLVSRYKNWNAMTPESQLISLKSRRMRDELLLYASLPIVFLLPWVTGILEAVILNLAECKPYSLKFDSNSALRKLIEALRRSFSRSISLSKETELLNQAKPSLSPYKHLNSLFNLTLLSKPKIIKENNAINYLRN